MSVAKAGRGDSGGLNIPLNHAYCPSVLVGFSFSMITALISSSRSSLL